MTNIFDSEDAPIGQGPELSPGVDPCRACGNPLQACNLTCPKCGEIADGLLFATINSRKLKGEQREAYRSGLAEGRAWYRSQLTTEIDPPNYHPTPGLEDYFRTGWKAGVEAASRPRGLHRIFRSPFDKYSEHSVFQVVDGEQVIEEIRGVERLRAAIIQGHLKRTTPIRIARDPDGLILVREGKVKSLLDIAKGDLRVDSLYRPIRSYARRGADWGYKIAGVIQPLIWTCLLLRTNPITAISALSILIFIIGFRADNVTWMPFAPLVLFAVLTFLSGDISIWVIFVSIPLLAAVTGRPAGMCIGSVLGLVRTTRAPVAEDRIWEDRILTIVRTICVPLVVLALLGAISYFQWDGITGMLENFIDSTGGGGIQWRDFL